MTLTRTNTERKCDCDVFSLFLALTKADPRSWVACGRCTVKHAVGGLRGSPIQVLGPAQDARLPPNASNAMRAHLSLI